MNILPLVFSLLSVLAFGSLASLQRQHALDAVIQSGKVHLAMQRKIVARCERAMYQKQKGSRPQHKRPIGQNTQKKKPKNPSSPRKISTCNPECARLNIYPLIQDGKEAHPALTQMFQALLESFYLENFFEKDRKQLVQFCDVWLFAVQQQPGISWEKLVLPDKQRMIYYRMLKGAHRRPLFCDYVRSDSEQSPLCMYHAAPPLLEALFPKLVAEEIFAQLHETGSMAKEEWIKGILQSAHRQTGMFSELDKKMELHWKAHPIRQKEKSIVIETDVKTGRILRKKISRFLQEDLEKASFTEDR